MQRCAHFKFQNSCQKSGFHPCEKVASATLSMRTVPLSSCRSLVMGLFTRAAEVFRSDFDKRTVNPPDENRVKNELCNSYAMYYKT